MAGYATFNDMGAVVTCNGPETLVGRRVLADYAGFGDGRHYNGTIVEVVYADGKGGRVWAYGVTFPGYNDCNGKPIVVDLRRGEFMLPRDVR